ncbi:MAG: YcxB family protein [Anaerovoracaceae bacterium]
MAEPKFVVETELKRKDYIKFLYVSAFFKKKITVPVLMGAAVAISAFIGIRLGKDTPLDFLIFFLGALAVLLCGVVIRVQSKGVRKIKKIRKEFYGKPSTYKFYKEGLVLETGKDEDKVKSSLKYENFYGVIETKKLFILYFSQLQGSVFRKEDVEDVETFTKFLRERFGNRYRKFLV